MLPKWSKPRADRPLEAPLGPLLAHSRIRATTNVRAEVELEGICLQTSSKTVRIAEINFGSNCCILCYLLSLLKLKPLGLRTLSGRLTEKYFEAGTIKIEVFI
jgi:hypothetical protein